MADLNNCVGTRFDRLTVLCERPRPGVVSCRCDCGEVRDFWISNLRRGRSRSCGCLQAELLADRNRVHGRSRTSEHTIWKGLRQRCGNPKNPAWKYYGGRGITVCDRWREFAAFYADMGPRPLGKSLDRVDNDGPYSPENCRWATPLEQCANRRPANIRGE